MILPNPVVPVLQTSMMMGINSYSAALSMCMLLLHNTLFSAGWFMVCFRPIALLPALSTDHFYVRVCNV
jgi:hypothetical protein